MKKVTLFLPFIALAFIASGQQFPNASNYVQINPVLWAHKNSNKVANTPDTLGRFYLVCYRDAMKKAREKYKIVRRELPPYVHFFRKMPKSGYGEFHKPEDVLKNYPQIAKAAKEAMDEYEKANWYKDRYNDYLSATGDFRIFLPTWSSAIKDTTFVHYVFTQSTFNAVSDVQIKASSGQSSVYSELLGTSFGHTRASIGTLFNTATGASDTTLTLQTLANAGGNLSLNFYYPLVYYSNDHLDILMQYSPKLGFQIPGMGTYSSNYTWNAQPIALDLYVDFTSVDKKMGFFMFTRGYIAYGSPDFFKNLGASEKKSVAVVNANLGVLLNSNIRIIGTTPPIWSGSPEKPSWTIGFSFMPNYAKR